MIEDALLKVFDSFIWSLRYEDNKTSYEREVLRVYDILVAQGCTTINTSSNIYIPEVRRALMNRPEMAEFYATDAVVDYDNVFSIKDKIAVLSMLIHKLQSECPHPTDQVTIKHQSNTGGYSPSDDMYWTDHHCLKCDKKWSVDR